MKERLFACTSEVKEKLSTQNICQWKSATVEQKRRQSVMVEQKSEDTSFCFVLTEAKDNLLRLNRSEGQSSY